MLNHKPTFVNNKWTFCPFFVIINMYGVVFWFRHMLLDMIASGRHTLSANLKLNDETNNYSFAPAFA